MIFLLLAYDAEFLLQETQSTLCRVAFFQPVHESVTRQQLTANQKTDIAEASICQGDRMDKKPLLPVPSRGSVVKNQWYTQYKSRSITENDGNNDILLKRIQVLTISVPAVSRHNF